MTTSLLDFPLTDAGNAERLIALHGQNLRRCSAWNRWLGWDGRRWAVDDDAVYRHAKATARALHAEVLKKVESEDRRKALIGFALKSESRRGIEATVALAGHEKAVAISPDELDADAWLLNVANGTIDLRTGKLSKHDREKLITKLIPVEHDPGALCPTWLAFLRRVLGDSDNLINFVWKGVGYSLTGNVSEQVLFFLLGLGANGKSTLLTVLRELLDGYAQQADPELLLAKTRDAHPTGVADLFACRLAICTEIGAGRALDEVTVKQLTGGDRVKARRLYENLWEFTPTHKLWVAANHKPRVTGTDHAIWRRILLVPFDVTIPATERDPKLGEKLRAELPGILNWAVQGCLAWQREGLGAPDEVKAATDAYRAEQDVLAAFLGDACEFAADAKVTARDLLTAYSAWCAENGEQPVKQRTFTERLRERGVAPGRGSKGVRLWTGLRLTAGDGWRLVMSVSGNSSMHPPGRKFPENNVTRRHPVTSDDGEAA